MQNVKLYACIFSFTFFAFLTCAAAGAAEVVGVPRIVDGDTLVIGTAKIRLQGVDAPETDQLCLNSNGSSWTCESRPVIASPRTLLAGKLFALPAALTCTGECLASAFSEAKI